jgi:hypothetical protein
MPELPAAARPCRGANSSSAVLVQEIGHRVVPIGSAEVTEEEPTAMTDGWRMAPQDLLRKAELERDVDFLREGSACWPGRRRSWRGRSTWGRSAAGAPQSGAASATGTGSGTGTPGSATARRQRLPALSGARPERPVDAPAWYDPC